MKKQGAGCGLLFLAFWLCYSGLVLESARVGAVPVSISLSEGNGGHIVTFLYRAYHNVQPTHTWQGDPSLDFTAQLSTGESFTLSKQTGKVVLVNFWATFTWGITSVEELSVFSQLYSEYSTDEVKMVFINCGESPQTVQSFLDRAGCTLPVICDTNDTISSAYASANGTTLIPRTVIFGKDGTISADYFGSQSYQIVKSLIDNALEGRTD